MAGPIFIIILTCLVTISTVNTRAILDKNLNRINNPSLSFNRTLLHSNLDECIAVQAVKQLECPLTNKDNIYRNTFESVCQQHQLCYACGSVHGFTEDKCNKLSRMNMYEKCSENLLTQIDCLKSHFIILSYLTKDIYRSSHFSFECYDKCVLHYFFTSFDDK